MTKTIVVAKKIGWEQIVEKTGMMPVFTTCNPRQLSPRITQLLHADNLASLFGVTIGKKP